MSRANEPSGIKHNSLVIAKPTEKEEVTTKLASFDTYAFTVGIAPRFVVMHSRGEDCTQRS